MKKETRGAKKLKCRRSIIRDKMTIKAEEVS
jgi:hypothetical protein